MKKQNDFKNFDNYSREVIDLICDSFHDDERLVMDVLFYLFHTSNDDILREQIIDVFNDSGYCISCGAKLETRTIKEIHDELDERAVEYFTEIYCPNCDR